MTIYKYAYTGIIVYPTHTSNATATRRTASQNPRKANFQKMSSDQHQTYLSRNEESQQREDSDRGETSGKAESVKQELSADYQKIAELAASLDSQIKTFVGNMNSLVESVPSYDTLTGIWEEQDEASKGRSTQTKSVPAQASVIMGDERRGNNNIKLL
jgi:hypothetical protein